jgi:excisionase family DNA binding protein
VHEKQVYALVKGGRIPATKRTGKWLFPKRLVDEWLEEDARAGVAKARTRAEGHPGALLAAGSNDPVLDLLLAQMRREHPELYVFSCTTGSTGGLRALAAGSTDIAFSHLLDAESGEYNLPFLARLAPGVDAVVVNLFWRELGIVTARRNPHRIARVADLGRRGVRIVNRQAGAGVRVFFDRALAEAGVAPGKLAGYENEVFTHQEVGLAVLAGDADAGLATAGVASLFGLGFAHLANERFDMALRRDTYFTRPLQALLGVLRAPAFRERATKIRGYDFAESGKIVFPE